MNLPDDFGYSPAAALSHVADTTPGPWHAAFWQWWASELRRGSPRLTSDPPRDASDPGATHGFTSMGGVRIGARLVAPRGAAVGAVVVPHGYGGVEPLARDEEQHRTLAAQGLAVLLVRVRGYPGSQLDVGPLCEHPTGYITIGLDALMHGPQDAKAWILPHAAADVANACRALAAHMPGLPVLVRAESFGAGLAVIAAAQLSQLPEPGDRVELGGLALGAPTLGDWPFRAAIPDARLPKAGMNREVREVMIRNAEREGAILDVLRLCDAAVHARMVRRPALVKLAFRDDLVPAPTQAAVFNALGTDTGLKQRFPVRYGHFDGGLANARRHAEFDRLAAEFLRGLAVP